MQPGGPATETQRLRQRTLNQLVHGGEPPSRMRGFHASESAADVADHGQFVTETLPVTDRADMAPLSDVAIGEEAQSTEARCRVGRWGEEFVHR